MRVYLWYHGENHPRALREDNPALFLRTTVHTDCGTDFRPDIAELHRTALRSYCGDMAVVWCDK